MLYEVLQQLLPPCKTSYVQCCEIRGYFAVSVVAELFLYCWVWKVEAISF